MTAGRRTPLQGEWERTPIVDLEGSLPEWMVDAACGPDSGIDPDDWFPAKGQNTHRLREVCMACPVRALCLDFALAQPRPVPGVWGGTTDRQRRRMLRDARGVRDTGRVVEIELARSLVDVDDEEWNERAAASRAARRRGDAARARGGRDAGSGDPELAEGTWG